MRRVTPSDYPEIIRWFKRRKLPTPPSWLFSDEGFIAPGVAAGFLYLTNSGIARIDCYITNPEADKADRTKALEDITSRILYVAKHEYAVRMIVCDTKLGKIEEMAKAFRFKESGAHNAFYKTL